METSNPQPIQTFRELIGFHPHTAEDYPIGASYMLDIARRADAQQHVSSPRLVEPGVKTYRQLLQENMGLAALAETITDDYVDAAVA